MVRPQALTARQYGSRLFLLGWLASIALYPYPRHDLLYDAIAQAVLPAIVALGAAVLWRGAMFWCPLTFAALAAEGVVLWGGTIGDGTPRINLQFGFAAVCVLAWLALRIRARYG